MKKIYLTLSSCLLCIVAIAQNPVSEALPFVQLDYNPASISMGSTYIGSAAMVPLSDSNLNAGALYQSYMPEIDGTQYMGVGVSGKKDALGLSLAFVRGKGAGITGEKFSPSEMMLNIGAGYAFTENLSAGINVKYARDQILSDYSHGAVAADIFVAGKMDRFDYAGGVSSIGQKVASESTGSFRLPSAATLGCGYTVGEEHVLRTRVKADFYFSKAVAAGIGAEYAYKGMVSARCGYHYGGDSVIPSFASAGLGLHIGDFTIDAAYLFASDVLKNSFAVSAGVRF
jgi:hypothetical protein